MLRQLDYFRIAVRSLFFIALVTLRIGLGFTNVDAQPFAYVTNSGSNNVSVIDTSNNAVVATVTVGGEPRGAAITPDGAVVYVINRDSDNVSVINTSTNTVVVTVPVGDLPSGVAVRPDGAFVYVTNQFAGTVSVISTSTNTAVATVSVGDHPIGVAITPNGAFAYVTNAFSDNVSVINTSTNTVVVTVPVGDLPIGVAVRPDGASVYVTNTSAGTVSVISTSTNTVVATVPVGVEPVGVAITPDGAFVYVTNEASDNVSVINTSTNTIVATVPVGDLPVGVAITPNGAFVYVTNAASDNVSVINTSTNSVVTTVPVGAFPAGIAISPATAPTITITSPAANATYQLNANVAASYACADNGSGVASCQGTVANGSSINTSSTGTKTFTVIATDNAGNTRSSSVTYNVVSGGGGGSKSADLGITLSAPSKVSPGGSLTYAITVTNGGKVTATSVIVSNPLPAGTVFANATTTQGLISAPLAGSNGTVTVSLGNLANGANAKISIVATVPETTAVGTDLNDTATVTATTQDLNGANNSASQTTKVSKK